jgi:glycosyltransferase involved in cell wall biosynthesis
VRILFVLPDYSDFAIGGYKVVYEHANRLAERGHQISVVLPRQQTAREGLLAPALDAVWSARTLRRTGGKPVSWFEISPKVKIVLAPDLREKWLPDSDAVIATFWSTAPIIDGYSNRLGRKFHLVQHYETFGGPKQEVDAALALPIEKLVISKWLIDTIKEISPKARCHFIPNALDFHEFMMSAPIEGRLPHILTMAHNDAIKGFSDALAALEMIKEVRTDVGLTVFGVAEKPYYLPDDVAYVRRPDRARLRELYNDASIFMYASWSEGWGLTPAEAMACGCAVVCADNLGVREYAQPDKNMILTPVRRPHILASKCLELLQDEPRRVALARNGHESIQAFTWDRAVTAMESALSS